MGLKDWMLGKFAEHANQKEAEREINERLKKAKWQEQQVRKVAVTQASELAKTEKAIEDAVDKVYNKKKGGFWDAVAKADRFLNGDKTGTGEPDMVTKLNRLIHGE